MGYSGDVLDEKLKQKLVTLTWRLIDQKAAKILVAPQKGGEGFWFGGGNIIRDTDGTYYLVGRYRNHGDSRTGLGAGERGVELAIFAASDLSGSWEKVKAFSKNDLQVGGATVLSIEGTHLRVTSDSVELYVSSEKDVPYPEAFRDYQKPGTGVWSIDSVTAGSVVELNPTDISPVLASGSPAMLHVKDPTVFDLPGLGTAMIVCTHPFSWSSSNTGLAVRREEENAFVFVADHVLPRGPVWDVAATRVTERMPVPRVGAFADVPPVSLYFYDGAECLRAHEQHARAVERPRGYSCEEIGGLAWGFDVDFPRVQRLSVDFPLFVSPHGTGCSRYVSVFIAEEGLLASWQQSQTDLSQPLVGHWLPMEAVVGTLT